MKPQLRLLDTYRTVVAESRARVDGAIPRVTGLRDAPPEPAALPVIRRDWSTARTALDSIDTLFDDLAEALWTEYTNTDLTDQARKTRVQQTIAHYRALFDTQSQAATVALTSVLKAAAKAGLPARPQPQDALQEARIAGIKSDLTMLLANRTNLQLLVDEVDRYLTEAMGRGDTLAVWVVAGSGWLDLYIRGRGDDQVFIEAAITSLDSTVGRRLDSQPLPEPAFDTRTLNRVISDPQRGVQAILTVLGGFAVNVFQDLAEWAPLGSAARGY